MLTAPITAAKDVETFFRIDPTPQESVEVPVLPAVGDGDALDALDMGADTPEAPAPNSGGDDPEAEAFTPDTPDKADWVLGKIADARARAARVRENAEKIARQHEAEAEALEWRFGTALQTLCRQETDGTRRKSLRLLNGVIGFKTRPAGVTVTDPGKALEWARENLPAAVVEALDRKALTTRLMETGEAVTFAAFQPEEETFYIK